MLEQVEETRKTLVELMAGGIVVADDGVDL